MAVGGAPARAGRVGLSLLHNRPRAGGEFERLPSAALAVGGAYLALHGCGPCVEHIGGPRGRVCGYSRASRRRLLDLLNQLKRASVVGALFVTLTYPDLFDADPAVWHRDLKVMLQRLERRYPAACTVWRLELKRRQSGQNAGAWAPHFHLLVLNVPRVSLEWLSRSWYDVVGSGDPRHLRAGTSAERARTFNAVAAYILKYCGKAQEEGFDGWTGRVWGVSGRGQLPRLLEEIALSWRQFYQLRRMLRAWVRSKNGYELRSRYRGQGLTAYLPADAAVRLLSFVAEDA